MAPRFRRSPMPPLTQRHTRWSRDCSWPRSPRCYLHRRGGSPLSDLGPGYRARWDGRHGVGSWARARRAAPGDHAKAPARLHRRRHPRRRHLRARRRGRRRDGRRDLGGVPPRSDHGGLHCRLLRGARVQVPTRRRRRPLREPRLRDQVLLLPRRLRRRRLRDHLGERARPRLRRRLPGRVRRHQGRLRRTCSARADHPDQPPRDRRVGEAQRWFHARRGRRPAADRR